MKKAPKFKSKKPDLSITTKTLQQQSSQILKPIPNPPKIEITPIKPLIPAYPTPTVKMDTIFSDYMLDMMILILGSTGFFALGLSLGMFMAHGY